MKPWLISLCLIVAVITGCSSGGGKSQTVSAQHHFTANDVVQALNNSGLAASLGSEIPEGPFGVKGYAIQVGSETVQVYVFASESEQQRVTISADGFAIGRGNVAAQVEWVAPPHFTRKGNIIVTFITHQEQLATQVQRAVEGLK